MRPDRPSRTAAWVAAARGLADVLPPEQILVRDPFGLRFAEGPVRAGAEWMLRHPGTARRILARVARLERVVLWMQIRTRWLDDVMLGFVREGGRQIVLLGAGYDCRALRYPQELAGCRVFEVDHPATQGRKLDVLAGVPLPVPVSYLAWDFAEQSLDALTPTLHARGVDPQAPVLVIWEGVTPYLDESAIDACVRALLGLAATGSTLAFTWVDRSDVTGIDRDARLTARLVAGAGEPYRFGWAAGEVAGWLAARGFTLVDEQSDVALAQRWLPARAPIAFERPRRWIGVARST